MPWSLIHTSLQASLRNLVLDVTPGEQLAVANAWHGRFNHIGNIVGFTMGSCLLSVCADQLTSQGSSISQMFRLFGLLAGANSAKVRRELPETTQVLISQSALSRCLYWSAPCG